MVGTITPIVNGEVKTNRPLVVLISYVLGCILGGAAFGSLLGWLGLGVLPWPSDNNQPVLAATAFMGGFFGLHELNFLRVPAPQFRWQVPLAWRRRPYEVMAFKYGVVLGMGAGTRIPVRTFHLIVLWTFLCASPILGALALGTFGLVRSLPVIAISLGSKYRDLSDRIEALETGQSIAHRMNGLFLLMVGTSCLIAVLLVMFERGYH